jgi:hypothetical protein
MKFTEISDAAKNATIDRKDFDAALQKMLALKPLPTKAVSRKIALKGRARPLTRSLDRQ